MNTKFHYQKQEIRTLTDENEQTWFAGVDICNVLGYADSYAAIEKLEEDEKKLDRLRVGLGQPRKTWTVNEFGLYSLILTSSKPEAKPFKRWVTHEVLPSIRKAGKYTTDQEQKYEADLQKLVNEIESLKLKKEASQKQTNQFKKDIEEKTIEMIRLIKTDKHQLSLGI